MMRLHIFFFCKTCESGCRIRLFFNIIYRIWKNRGNPISKDKIDMAVYNLYGSWDGFPADSVSFISDALERKNYGVVYAEVMEREKDSKDMLIHFGEKYPDVITQSNVNETLASLKQRNRPL